MIRALQLRYIIYPIEGMMRFWYHLNPRVYSRRLRIRRISVGRRKKNSDRFLLFVLYASHEIPSFTDNILAALERSDINVVISTNSTPTSEIRDALLARCHLLIERADLGRDFGGYRDGISILQERYERIERLILLNDSLFFVGQEIGKLIDGLNGSEDLIGMTEVFEHHYHIGSYAISFSERVLAHKHFKRYWADYRPISTRRWSIHKGEVRLTAVLMRAGFKPHILYHSTLLYPHLRDIGLHELIEAIRLLPSFFREKMHEQFEELWRSQDAASLATVDVLSKSVRRFEKVGDPSAGELRDTLVKQLLSLNQQTTITQAEDDRRKVEDLVRGIVSTIFRRNQMHVAGFLFMKYLGMPAFKRDIFYREVYRLEDIDDILSKLAVPMKSDILADLRKKGSQDHLRGLRRILASHGSI
jgi:hypothetical protein